MSLMSNNVGYEVLAEYAGLDMTRAFSSILILAVGLKHLVDEHHAWVNYELLLDRCFLGFILN